MDCSLTASQEDQELRAEAGAQLVQAGFAPWGKDAWVRDDEGGGTCYDTPWALSEAGLPELAAKVEAVMEREAEAQRPPAAWDDPRYGRVVEIENVGDGSVVVVFANGDRCELDLSEIGVSPDSKLDLNEDDEIVVDEGDRQFELDWLAIRSASDSMFAAYLRERDQEDSKRVGQGLQRLRQKRSLSVSSAANLAGLTEAQVSAIESGSEALKLADVKSLLRAYGADWTDLIEAQA